MIKLTEEQLKEKAAFIDSYIGNSANNASNSEVDPNANVTIKNVATMDTELNKAEDVQVNRYLLKNKIADMFGEDEARMFISKLENHEIYSHDESGVLKPYCAAIDSSPLMTEGMIPLGGDSKAPQHLASFCGEYVNMIYFVASELCGAVADVALLTQFSYYAKKDYGANYLVTAKKTIEDSLQFIMYTLNQPAASRGNQSVFYNTSIFDRYYFDALLSHVVYPDGSSPTYEEIAPLQRFFMRWFNKERERALLTFPVVTAAYLVEDGEPKDKEFVDFLASEMAEGNSFFHYSSFTVDSLASCCFSGEQEVQIVEFGNDPEEYRRIKRRTFKTLWENSEISGNFMYDIFTWHGNTAKARLVRYPGKPMYTITALCLGCMGTKTVTCVCTEDHLFPIRKPAGSRLLFVDVFAHDLRVRDIFTSVDDEPYMISEIKKQDVTPEYVYCFEMLDEDNPYFALANGIITHNCRLRNSIDTTQFAYTLGGTGIMTGSKKVFTIDVNSLVQENRDIENEVKHIHRYLVAYNEMLYNMQKHNMLPIYDAHYINLDKQYLTIGVNGIVEAAEYLGYRISDNAGYINWVSTLLGKIKQYNADGSAYYTQLLGHKIMFNTELVPAENVGVKFAKWDKAKGLSISRDCYNSYLYIVESDSCTIADKFRMHGKQVLDNLDGGSAVHLNIKECPNKGTWLKIIALAIKAGCNYWTYNVRETCCNDCGFISKEDRQTCPKCGSKNVTWATRIIGYLKKVISFSAERQTEEKKRFKH